MMLLNIAFALKCNFNLIFFGQLKKADILYYDYFESIILNKAEEIIKSAKKKNNLFILDLKNNANMIMIAQKKGQPTYLLSKNIEMRL